jgi:MoaA/NifB/PqqE/SkfB family radical SAM enzyme
VAERLVVLCQVTEDCNLGCGFCAYDRRLPGPRRSADPARLEALGRRLAEWQQGTGRGVLVSWLGGEPLRWPPLAAVTRRFRALGLSVSVTTNGTTLGAARVRRPLLEDLSELTISIDGAGETHDRLRGWPGGFSFLARVVPRLAAERRGATPLLRANTVVMRDNVAQLPALWRTLAGWGFDELTWNQLGGRDRPEFFPDHRLRPDDGRQLAEMLPALRAELAGRGVQLRGDDAYLARAAASAEGRPLPVADCSPGERFLFVSVDGRVGPCSFTASELGVPVEALAGDWPAGFRAARARSRPRPCDDCPSTQVFGKFQVAR